MGLGGEFCESDPNLAIVLPSHVHRGRAFTGAEVVRYTERLHVHTSRAIQKLQALGGQPVECGHLLDALAFDVYVEQLYN